MQEQNLLPSETLKILDKELENLGLVYYGAATHKVIKRLFLRSTLHCLHCLNITFYIKDFPRKKRVTIKQGNGKKNVSKLFKLAFRLYIKEIGRHPFFRALSLSTGHAARGPYRRRYVPNNMRRPGVRKRRSRKRFFRKNIKRHTKTLARQTQVAFPKLNNYLKTGYRRKVKNLTTAKVKKKLRKIKYRIRKINRRNIAWSKVTGAIFLAYRPELLFESLSIRDYPTVFASVSKIKPVFRKENRLSLSSVYSHKSYYTVMEQLGLRISPNYRMIKFGYNKYQKMLIPFFKEIKTVIDPRKPAYQEEGVKRIALTQYKKSDKFNKEFLKKYMPNYPASYVERVVLEADDRWVEDQKRIERRQRWLRPFKIIWTTTTNLFKRVFFFWRWF